VQDDLHYLRESARHAAARGDVDTAIATLVQAAAQTHVAEQDYVSVLRPLADALTQRGDLRSALSVEWYIAQGANNGFARARAYLPRVPPVDRARTFAAEGAMGKAAHEMEEAGLVAAAAIFREKATDYQGARALWSRLGQVTLTASATYDAALVQFNIARCAKLCGDTRQSREAIVASVRLLEEAADHFESVGQRERAFDCFQVLVQIGRESEMFEDVLEGFVNCVRILREDHLKYFALQYFDDGLSAAREKSEFSAAATLAREAAEYARALGLVKESAHYAMVQASLWKDVAKQHLERGAPPEIAENAMLAAIFAFGEIGQFARVGQHYEELAHMGLEPQRRAHYARAALRYAGVKDEPVDASPVPSQFRQKNHFPDVWHVDLIEWEQQGSAAEACADILLDTRWPELIRRKALLARLTAIAIDAHPADVGPAATSARIRLAEQLAQLQLYAVLSPLEKLYERPEKQIKLAVLRAMQTLFFKRSFITVRAGLRDADPDIIESASRAVEALHFQHAFDPLARIVREAPQLAVRANALRALSRIDSREAAEFLLGILDHGAPGERSAARDGLKRARGMKFVELATTAMATSTPELQAVLREVLRARGYAT
jgi:hypothetical protein